MIPDHYATLGLNPSCEDAVVHGVYRALMRKYHPDQNSSMAAAERARAIKVAYAVLGDPDKRMNYDATQAHLLGIEVPANEESHQREFVLSGLFSAAAALCRRGVTAADVRAKELWGRAQSQSKLAPALIRSVHVAANRQGQRFKLAGARLHTFTTACHDTLARAAGSRSANWRQLTRRDIANTHVESTPELREGKSGDASGLFCDDPLDALKSLSAHQTLTQLPPALLSILADESDRGAVVLVGSLAEGLLADRIIAALPNGERHRSELLGRGGILSSFPAKITMGQVLGVIDAETAENLSVLANMRRICAQSKINISLRTRELQEVFCQLLRDDAAELVRTATNQEIPRLLFNGVVVYICEILLGASLAQAKRVFDDMLKDTFPAAIEED